MHQHSFKLRRPVIKAEKMACGILPGNKDFRLQDLYFRDQLQESITDSIVALLNGLGVVGGSLDAIRRSADHKSTWHHWPGFSDIMALWCDWVPLRGSSINSVISPIGQRLDTMCGAYEARVVWRWILQEQDKAGNISKTRKRVLELYNQWVQEEPSRFYQNYTLAFPETAYDRHISFFKKTYDETTRAFEKACRKGSSSLYIELVLSHIRTNAYSLEEADEHIKAGTSRNDGRVGHNLWDTLFTERAFQYVDNLPNVIFLMTQNGYPEDVVEDAWWMLMLRGQCWEMGVNRVVQKSCVPSSYYNSPTKVYIL
jgi:hypothetical protein